jgi:hypothetical protein
VIIQTSGTDAEGKLNEFSELSSQMFKQPLLADINIASD